MTQTTSGLAEASSATVRTPSRHRFVRWLLIATGSLLVGVGVLGVFLPLLPSTVFFLMAAGCFGKSSPTAYTWLTTNRWFGRYLREYKEEGGATVAAKAVSVGSLWLGIALSAWLIDVAWVRLALLVVACCVTFYLIRLRTIRR